MNIFVTDDTQVIYSSDWLEKMNIRFYDTGNTMTNEEIVDFSSSMDMQELKSYRKTVGRRTREIIKRQCKDEGKLEYNKKNIDIYLKSVIILLMA